MKHLVHATIFSALIVMVCPTQAHAQVGRRGGQSERIVVPLETPPVPPQQRSARADAPANGAVVKCESFARPQTEAAPGGAQAQTPAADAQAEEVFRGSEVDTKAVVTHAPDPVYTEEARSYSTNGKVALRVTLAPTGKVSEVKVLRALPDGLTENAIDAACQIEFTPARKGGNAVAQYVMIEYNFETDDAHLPPPMGRRFPPGVPPARAPRFPRIPLYVINPLNVINPPWPSIGPLCPWWW